MKAKIFLVAIAVAVLVALPWLVSTPLLNAAVQMLIAALFAMAFSFLCGRAGMLSFGHAAYFGIGAFAAVHAMNAFGGAGLLPTPLLPLVGAGTGLLGGLIAGYFATKRTGVYFAMITLALAELLHALAPHLKGTFGGEAGISSFRMPAWGFTFGSVTEVYFLTLAWVLLCIGLLWLLGLTPLGRLALGLRENGHRLRFLGYNVHALSTLVFAVSAMFAGVAGALQSLNIEAANYVVLEAHVSTSVVLNSFIGGVRVFLGPAIGGAAMTFFGYITADLTRVWLLYQGIIFVLVMMFLPRGLVGELVERFSGGERRSGGTALLDGGWRLAGFAMAAAGCVFLVEFLQRFLSTGYRATATGENWPPIELMGFDWSPGSPLTWLLPAALLAAGLWLLGAANKRAAAQQEALA
ncbi:branched-chain amino acid ABC transporter permease [Limimaricola pyoseonensis]|uniref:Amino acid/amide ABC transporter membrane protein 2, HAAT family n=1 Tax=Limimaricola pyoseonensis TaxID=521013 RepID=A0A1G7HH44_9RHOB|nr:branched-chain amino acid ABC transporter permease [Limimaricola pyoseonensis]SDE99681.1 amino acid/amide ABC transporter membrane protein 2, HAAT family [Limimaricola pyoseonensis]